VQHGDREEFDKQVALLCDAFDVPPGNRPDAYWAAFEKISLVEFARMVAAALADETNERVRIPTVSQLWAIRRKLRSRPVAGAVGGQTQADLVAQVVSRFRFSDAQLAMPWNWIARNPAGDDCTLIGVIVPQDAADPVRFPARRLTFAEIEVSF
jgi:hypothetical protein